MAERTESGPPRDGHFPTSNAGRCGLKSSRQGGPEIAPDGRNEREPTLWDDRPLNAYMVRTKDERTYTEPIMDDGSGPEMTCWPMAPVVAETPAQAKALFLQEFSQGISSGVERDDYPNLRVRTLLKNVDLPRGVRADDLNLWLYEPDAE